MLGLEDRSQGSVRTPAYRGHPYNKDNTVPVLVLSSRTGEKAAGRPRSFQPLPTMQRSEILLGVSMDLVPDSGRNRDPSQADAVLSGQTDWEQKLVIASSSFPRF